MFNWNFLYFSLCQLLLHLWAPLGMSPSSLPPPINSIHILIRTHPRLLFSSLNNTNSLSIISYQMLQSLTYLHDLSLNLLQYIHTTHVLGSPELDPALKMSHQRWIEGKDHFPLLPGDAFPSTTHETVGLLCHRGTLLAHDQLVVH